MIWITLVRGFFSENMTIENIEQTPKNFTLGELISMSLSDVPGVLRRNHLESIREHNGRLRANITLCPLYAQGSMEQSILLDSPNAVEESRVAGKWHAGIAMIGAIQERLEQVGYSLHVVFTFADLGVLVHQNFDEAMPLLDRHRTQYETSAQSALENSGVTWEFQSYSQMGIEFPQFTDPNAGEAAEGNSRREIVDRLAREVAQYNVLDEGVIARFNKKVRPIVTSMLNAFGYDLARLFLLQYGTFDAITSRPGDLNCYFERGELLLNMTNLFPHGNDPEISRVDIKV